MPAEPNMECVGVREICSIVHNATAQAWPEFLSSRGLRCARSAATTYCQIRLRRPRSRAWSPRRLHRFATATDEKSGLVSGEEQRG
jgi:hypothetical protein